MRFVCLTPAIVALLSLLVLFCDETSFVAGSYAKQCGTNNHHFNLCHMTQSTIDTLLNRGCVKRRKRAQAQSDKNVLQSPEEARSFLKRSTQKYVINYGLFMEECCVEGCCRREEIMEHCLPSSKN